MLIFFFAFFDWRRPLRLVHLDLLVLLSFSALAVLLQPRRDRRVGAARLPGARLPADAHAGGRLRARAARARPARCAPLVPVAWLVIALIFLVGFRVGLNVTDSNVIDVGYSGVIGADRITHGESPYGNFPSDNRLGDTYGPGHLLRVRARASSPSRGRERWDDLPAAHAAAIGFDLLTMRGAVRASAGACARGREGTELGVVLAYRLGGVPVHAVRAQLQRQRLAGRRRCSPSRCWRVASPPGAGCCWRWRRRPSSRRSRWRRCSPATTGGACATRCCSRSRSWPLIAAGDAAADPRRRLARDVRPHGRLPARPRLAVQHLGPARRPATGCRSS